MILKNALVLTDQFSFEKTDLAVSGEKISAIGMLSSDRSEESIDCGGDIIVPGIIDIHTHGCLGLDSGDGEPGSYETMAAYYAKHGVTTYLATIDTVSEEKMLRAVKNIRAACEQGKCAANIGGIHLEGPYFSYKYKGAQDENYLRLPNLDEFRRLLSASGGLIRLVSLAPELPGAAAFIAEASKTCAVAMGHTDADYDAACAAIDAGATVMTHTFNAMRPLLHRSPNAIGAALEHENVFCEFIGDGFHISPTVLRLMYRLLSDERMLFISDSIRAAGLPDGEYGKIHVIDGKARLEDGTIAGSTVTAFDCVRNAISFGIPPESAFKMGSLTPARACGMDSVCGSITVGKRADLLILDRSYGLKRVMIRGKFTEPEK